MQGRPVRHILSCALVAALLAAGCITPTDDANATGDTPVPTDRWFEGTQPGEELGDEPEPSDEPSPSPTGSATTSPTPSNTTDPSPTPTDTSTPSPTPEPEGTTHTVEITTGGHLAEYDPDPKTIKVGDSIVWKNLDSALHTATEDDGAWDTKGIGGGMSSDPILFDTAGTYTYYCKAHPGTMNGAQIIVEA